MSRRVRGVRSSRRVSRSTIPRVVVVGSVLPSGIARALAGAGDSSTKRLAIADSPTARMVAIVPSCSGAKRLSSMRRVSRACPSWVTASFVIRPTRRPPTSTRPPLMTCPASANSAWTT
jgi:hypothetical protein